MQREFEIAAAIVGTFATGVAGVWLTGDARAFGVVVMIAGVAVFVVLGRNERRTQGPRREADATETRTSATTDVTKAA